jgi:hypothetical protein
MARFVTFNGITRFKPGGITKINAEALNQVLPSDNSIVALVGEADGGAPGATSGLITHFDPSRARKEFRSGPLVDAIRLAFQSSNDQDVPGGASRVLIYKTNASTQASTSVPTEEATFLAGSWVPNAAEVDSGSATTLVDSALTALFPLDDALNGKFVVLRPFTATAEVKVITDYTASTGTITVGASWGANPVAANDYAVLDNEVYDISKVTGGGTAVTFVNAALTADQHNGRWLHIQNTAVESFLVRIVDTAATNSLTVSPALPTLATGAVAQILPNALDLVTTDYGAHTNNVKVVIDDGVVTPNSLVVTTTFEGSQEQSPEVGGVNFMTLLYKGGGNAITDTVAALSTASVINLTTGGLTPSAHVGSQFYSAALDEYSTITANTASAITVSPAFSDIPTGTVNIRTVTGATATVSGSTGAATGLSTTLSGVTGDNLSITFTANMTLRQLQTAINANSNYVASLPAGINGDVGVAADFDFGPNTKISIMASPSLTTLGLRQDNVAMENYFNTTSELVTATRSAGGTLDGLIAPNATALAVAFSGGTRGISTNSNFQDGFDTLLLVRANSVVPLVDEDLTNEGFSSTATWGAVSAQLAAHVGAARAASQMTAGERGGFIGFQGTKKQIIAKDNSINDPDVQLTCQNPTVLDAFGNLGEQGPRMLAVMAASMRGGVSEVAEPLTHKYLRTSGLTNDPSWDPQDTTDANELIIGGVLFAESIDGVGTRWVRDLTTHVQDDNLAYTEGSVRDAVRYVAYGLRKVLVDTFTGKKATPASASSARDLAKTWLEVARGQNIIVDSTDPTTGQTINAYHNLRVTLSGDVMKVNVGIFPVPGINFVLNEIFLQLPSQAA